MDNFPGFELATSWVTAWSRLLETQANVFNDLWSKARQGTLGVDAATKAAASLYQAYWDTSSDMAKQALSPASPWVTFVVDKSLMSAPQQVVRLPQKADPTVELSWTPFRQLGGTESIAESAWRCAFTDDRRRDAILVSCDNAVIAKAPAGEYIGFAYGQRASNGTPLAIVLLRVV